MSNNDSANVLFEANTTLEKPLASGEDNPNVVPPYNAYSGVGTVNVSDTLHNNLVISSYCINALRRLVTVLFSWEFLLT